MALVASSIPDHPVSVFPSLNIPEIKAFTLLNDNWIGCIIMSDILHVQLNMVGVGVFSSKVLTDFDIFESIIVFDKLNL